MSVIEQIWSQFNAQSSLELLAVLLAIAYVLLARVQSVWCWPAAALNTALFTWLFWDVALLMESLLNAFYLVMAFYGFYQWRFGKQGKALKVSRFGRANILKSIAACTVVGLMLGWVMATYTHADFAYLDALTTVFAIFATFLLAKKVLENWLYWVVIDAVSVWLYWQKGLYFSSLMMLAYTFIAISGYLAWKAADEAGN